MKESIEVLQEEAGVIKRHIRMMKRVSDEYQTDLVKGWPEKLLDIEQGIDRLQKSEVAQNSTSTQQLKDSISELNNLRGSIGPVQLPYGDSWIAKLDAVIAKLESI